MFANTHVLRDGIASRIYVLLKDAGYCMYPNDVNYIFCSKELQTADSMVH